MAARPQIKPGPKPVIKRKQERAIEKAPSEPTPVAKHVLIPVSEKK